jgi:hypothetical protein
VALWLFAKRGEVDGWVDSWATRSDMASWCSVDVIAKQLADVDVLMKRLVPLRG